MCGTVMVFDILSFLAGVAAGAVTGALAGVLHGLEGTADLHERLRHLTNEVEKMRSVVTSHTSDSNEHDARSEMDDLYLDLNEIHEEIRRMYKKGKG
jgi:hypothetical protein